MRYFLDVSRFRGPFHSIVSNKIQKFYIYRLPLTDWQPHPVLKRLDASPTYSMASRVSNTVLNDPSSSPPSELLFESLTLSTFSWMITSWGGGNKCYWHQSLNLRYYYHHLLSLGNNYREGNLWLSLLFFDIFSRHQKLNTLSRDTTLFTSNNWQASGMKIRIKVRQNIKPEMIYKNTGTCLLRDWNYK